MSKLLTIFIPSYNRAEDLDRTLGSIYASIEAGRCMEEVDVLVVDDFSTEDVVVIAMKYRDRAPSLSFRLHAEKCGVAEAAMLRGLRYVATPYVWVVGNDDRVTIGSVSYVLEILAEKKPSFCLFNFVAERRSKGTMYETIAGVSDVINFETGERFFMNFGVVTSTTTFPCLCFEVAPLLQLNLERVIATSPIYSHTAAFFVAYFNRRCCFVNRIMAVFNHNEAIEEHYKLVAHNERMGRIPFYNWTLGLMRHLECMSAATGISLETLSMMSEDESLKETHEVKKTLIIYFIVRYVLDQMTQEVLSAQLEYCTTVHIAAEDVDACEAFLQRCGASHLLSLVKRAKAILVNEMLLTRERLDLFQRLSQELVDEEKKNIRSIDEARWAAFAHDGRNFDLLVRYANSGYKLVNGVSGNSQMDTPVLARLSMHRLIKAVGVAASRTATAGDTSVSAFLERCVDSPNGALPLSVCAVFARNRPDVAVFNEAQDWAIFSRMFGDFPAEPVQRSSSEICWWRTDLSVEDVCLDIKSQPKMKLPGVFVNTSLLSRPGIFVRSPLRILFVNHASE